MVIFVSVACIKRTIPVCYTLHRYLVLDGVLTAEISAALLIEDLLNCDNKSHYIAITPTLKQATSLTLIRLQWSLCSNIAMEANCK